MKKLALAAILIAMAAPHAAAGEGRGHKGPKKVPPGHVPPAGQCRVWYDGVPPGHQPRPTSCWEAERAAARDGNARVIYGSGSRRGDGDIWRQGGGGGGDRDVRRPRDDRRDRDRDRQDDEARRRGGSRDRGDRPSTGRAIPRLLQLLRGY